MWSNRRVIDGIEFWRVNNDVNGNPRYVVHFSDFSEDYKTAHKRANRIGYSVCRIRDFGGGFVGQSHDIRADAKLINEMRRIGDVMLIDKSHLTQIRYPGIDFDCALPQGWVDDMARDGIDVRRHFVWIYPPRHVFGFPGPIDSDGDLIAAAINEQRHVEFMADK